SDGAQRGAGGRAIVALAQASEHGDEKGTLARRRVPLSGDEEGLPLLERADRAGQHASERVVEAVEPNRCADRVRAAAKPPLPELVADDDDPLTARTAVVLVQRTAERRAASAHCETL